MLDPVAVYSSLDDAQRITAGVLLCAVGLALALLAILGSRIARARRLRARNRWRADRIAGQK